MARLPRATFSLLLALLPAIACLIGVVVLWQRPTGLELVGLMSFEGQHEWIVGGTSGIGRT